MATIVNEVNESFSFGNAQDKIAEKIASSTITITESQVREIEQVFNEGLSFYDTILRPANAVAHDLVIYDNVKTEDELLALVEQSPVGYDSMREFHPGDYEFRYGLVGVRIGGTTSTNRAGINGLQHNTDVRDVRDRGEATGIASSATWTHISYNKTYKTAPVVNVMQIGGATPGTPEAFNITNTGFDVRLRDITSPSTFVSGDISWTSEGF